MTKGLLCTKVPCRLEAEREGEDDKEKEEEEEERGPPPGDFAALLGVLVAEDEGAFLADDEEEGPPWKEPSSLLSTLELPLFRDAVRGLATPTDSALKFPPLALEDILGDFNEGVEVDLRRPPPPLPPLVVANKGLMATLPLLPSTSSSSFHAPFFFLGEEGERRGALPLSPPWDPSSPSSPSTSSSFSSSSFSFFPLPPLAVFLFFRVPPP